MTRSSSSSTFLHIKYEVFLSFRGEDTRYNFTSHLYKALRDKQIETFIDNELNRGDEISPSLLNAIEESQISVIIFSKGYASSRWCLEELVKILECKKRYGQIVMPIFYDVDPSDVRNQTGTFGDAFAKHEQCFKDGLDKLQRWRTALTEAANLSGWDSRVTKSDTVLIENIVKNILKRLNSMPLSDNNNLIGIDSAIRKIESLLCIGSNNVCSVGLWGIGGIGKTTLAGAVFDKISSRFEGSYFHNVREESKESGGLNHLQRELASKILGDGPISVGTSVIGHAFTKKRLCRKKILIVFDDVTDWRQIEFLVKDLNHLCLGSRIIITTRDKQVLNNSRVDHIYEVKGLLFRKALQLFSWYAFKQRRPLVDYMNISERVVVYTGGVPLALKVLGSFLLGKSKQEWESALDKIKRTPHMEIQKVLRISYDGLDDEEQNIFLDIACFLTRRDKDFVVIILDACGYSAEIGISVLIDKSMIIISDNKIIMHDLLQAMGREIVRQESIKDPSKRTRLWRHDDIYHVLTKNTGTETIEGISLDMSKTREIHINPHAFTKMHKLRFLEFYFSRDVENGNNVENGNKVYLSQSLESVSTELRYLCWHGFPSKSLLSNFNLENLVVLDMPHSNIEQLWNGVQRLDRLKKLNLSYCKHLNHCPDLSGLPNLESLILEGCTGLIEIPSSIQNHNMLDLLNLRYCKRLGYLPNLSGLKSLREVVLSGCSNLRALPEISCNVEELFLDETAIEELSSSMQYLSKLVTLSLKSCSRLKNLPSSISSWKSLQFLDLSHCSSLDELPGDVTNLQSLEVVKAEGTDIREVPSFNLRLNKLSEFFFIRYGGDPQSLLLSDLSRKFIEVLIDCGTTEIPYLQQQARLYYQQSMDACMYILDQTS